MVSSDETASSAGIPDWTAAARNGWAARVNRTSFSWTLTHFAAAPSTWVTPLMSSSHGRTLFKRSIGSPDVAEGSRAPSWIDSTMSSNRT